LGKCITLGTVLDVSDHPAKGHQQIEVEYPLPDTHERATISIVVPESEGYKKGDQVEIELRGV
jgi:hypothetical protein